MSSPQSATSLGDAPGIVIRRAAPRDAEAIARVRIDGWLVEASASDGWRWRSSTTRDDTGGGACEVVYVCGITRL